MSNKEKIIYRLNIIDLVSTVRVWLLYPSYMMFLSAFLLNKYSLLFIFIVFLLFVINKNEINNLLNAFHKFKQYFIYSVVSGIIFGLIAHYIKINGYMTIGAVIIIFYMIIVFVISTGYGDELFEKWKQGKIKARDKPEH